MARQFSIDVFKLTLVTFIFTFSSQVFAQGGVLEEVIVTAQKREQSIQDVGIAITAFSGDQLSALGVNESTEIVAMAPGVHVSASSAGQTRQFTIRGVTQNDFSDHAEAPNAVYIDEGYLASPQSQVFAAFDLERVEILKGPQGTLFGRNATGGLVHFVTRKPTDEFEAYAEAQYGEENQVRVEGAINGAVTDNLKLRLSGMYNRHDDIINNIYPFGEAVNPDTAGPPWFGSTSGGGPTDFWNDDQYALRGQALWVINDDAEFLVSGYYAYQQPASGPYQGAATTPICTLDPATGGCALHVGSIFTIDDPQNCEGIDEATGGCLPGGIGLLDGEFAGGIPGFAAPEDGLRPCTGCDLYGYRDPDGEDFDTSTDHIRDDYNRYKTHGVTAKLTWDLGNMTLTSVSHYIHNDKRQSLDVDSSPVAQLIVMNNQDTSSVTQELRLNGETDRYRWVVGAYYLWIDAGYNQGLANSAGGPMTTTLFPIIPIFTGGVPTPVPPLEADTIATLKTNSYSLFGQIDYDINEQWTIILGIRGIQEEKDFDFTNAFYINVDDATFDGFDPANLFPFIPGYAPFSDTTSNTLWTGKVQLDFKPNEDWLIYGSVNRGVKAGSFNAPLNDGAPRLSDDQFGYDEEVLLAFEVGFKTTLFDGTTRFNGAAYYYDYTDYQAFLFQGSAGAIFNNDANYKGVEFELQTNPFPGFDFIATASYIDPEIEGLAVANGVFRDVEPTFTPNVQLSGLARYEFQQDYFNGRVAIQMDANYASSAFHNIRNYDSQRMDDYILGNARVSWNSNDGVWEAQAFVTNLADERYKITGFDLSTLCGCSEEAYGRPRWWGIKVRYNFGAATN